MGYAIQKQLVLETAECCACGVVFAMPDYMMKARRNDGGAFFCPNGHSQHYTKSEVQRLREKLEDQTRAATKMAEKALAAEEAEQRAVEAAQKAQRDIDRMKKRASSGVCPCCNRTFQQLARHMKMKHPDHDSAVSSNIAAIKALERGK